MSIHTRFPVDRWASALILLAALLVSNSLRQPGCARGQDVDRVEGTNRDRLVVGEDGGARIELCMIGDEPWIRFFDRSGVMRIDLGVQGESDFVFKSRPSMRFYDSRGRAALEIQQTEDPHHGDNSRLALSDPSTGKQIAALIVGNEKAMLLLESADYTRFASVSIDENAGRVRAGRLTGYGQISASTEGVPAVVLRRNPVEVEFALAGSGKATVTSSAEREVTEQFELAPR